MDQAEKLRNVVKLKNQKSKPNARVITVTSGKGGVGKSNIAVNLGVQMQKLGKKVLVFDADFGLANVEVMFGAVPKWNLSDLIFRGKTIEEIISEGPLGMGFISGGTGITELSELTQDQLYYLIKCFAELDRMADVIIVDTGAGISNRVLEFVMASQEVIVVTTPDPSSLTDAYSLLKALYRNPKFDCADTDVSILANQVLTAQEGKNVYDKLNSVVDQFLQEKISYVGMIPQDQVLEKSIRQQKVVSLYAPASKSARAFEAMASRLLNHEQQQKRISRGISDLLSSFWKREA